MPTFAPHYIIYNFFFFSGSFGDLTNKQQYFHLEPLSSENKSVSPRNMHFNIDQASCANNCYYVQ